MCSMIDKKYETSGSVKKVRVFVSLVLLLASQTLLAGISITAVERAPATPFSQGVYRAVIIGNNTYFDPAKYWPNLKTAVSDARAIAQVLETQYGFTDVAVYENSTRREILHALNDLGKRVQSNDSVLIYYAGHGFHDEATQKGYWVPVDAEGTDQTTLLRNSTIRDEIGIISERAQHTLLISDSCFSGSLLRDGLRGVPAQEDSARYYEKVANKKSVQVMTAGGVEYVDDDYKGSGHSPFTYFLLNELKHNDKPMLIASELAGNVERVVASNVDQVPASGVLQGAGDEMGEFIFLKVNVAVEGIDPNKVKVQVDIVPRNAAAENAAAPAPAAVESNKGQGTGKKHSVVPLPSL